MMTLTQVFKKLRKAGLLARQRYRCCSSCMCAALADRFETTPGKYRGYVAFHQQDWSSYQETGKIYLRFGTAEDSEDDNREADYEIGHEVMDAFREGGWLVEWDGDPYSCIKATDRFFEPDFNPRWR